MSNLAPAVGFATKIIEMLSSESEAVGISGIARRCDINKNMAFRIMNTLEAEGWVWSDENARYRLSLLPFQITSRVLNQISLNNIAMPYVHELWKKTGESTYLGVLRDNQVLYLAHFDSVQNLRVAGVIGGTYPIYCTAPGKAILAFSEETYIEEYLEQAPFPKQTEKTISTRELLLAELASIREQGYSTDNEEFSPGIVCISAPIFDYNGKVAGAVGCSASKVLCKSASIVDIHGTSVIEAAKKISQNMGYIDRA